MGEMNRDADDQRPAAAKALSGEALVKEVNRLIRLARSHWDAHNNLACRTERDRALRLYDTMTKEEKEKVPQVLRVWLRYRSEKYFGAARTPPKGKRR
jgi:hypothetical protein